MKNVILMMLLSMMASSISAQYTWNPKIKEDINALLKGELNANKSESISKYMALNYAAQKKLLEKGIKEMVSRRVLYKAEADAIVKGFIASCAGDFKTSLNQYSKIINSPRRSSVGNVIYHDMNDMVHSYGYQGYDEYLVEVNKIEPIGLYDTDVFSDIRNPFGTDAIDLPSLMQSNIMIQQFGTNSLAKNGDLVTEGLKVAIGATTGALYALLDSPNYIGGNANLPKAFKEGYKDGKYLGDQAEELGKKIKEEYLEDDSFMSVPCQGEIDPDDCLNEMMFGGL